MKDIASTTKTAAKQGWSLPQLSEVCRLINGRAYKKKELLSEGRYRVLRVGNFFTNQNWYYSDLELDPDKYCDDGDLLYAWSASFGPRIWSGEKAIYHYHIWKVEPDRQKVIRDFLYYFFEWDKQLIREEQGAGATMIHVSKTSMDARAIPLPPLEEQKRIVAVLDQAFAALDRARAHAEANLADAEELFENSLRLTFAEFLASWGALPFDEACQTITPTEKIKQRDYLAEGDFPIVAQGAELVAGFWNDHNAVTETGGPVVIFGDHTRHLKHIDFTFVAGADGTKILKPADGMRSDFLYFALRSQPIEVTGYARHFKFLKDKVVPELPTLDQETICRSLWEMEGECRRLQENYEDKLTEIADLRQSLLQKAFSGQLTA